MTDLQLAAAQRLPTIEGSVQNPEILAQIQELIAAGGDPSAIISLLMQDFTNTINQAKVGNRTAAEEAMDMIRSYYGPTYVNDQFSELGQNAGNLGLDFENSDLARGWRTDREFLSESAEQALATDLAWFEKMTQAQEQLYNAMLTEMAAQMAMSALQPVGGSGGGGSGRGGGGSGNSGNYVNPDGTIGDISGLPADIEMETTASEQMDQFYPGFAEDLNRNTFGLSPDQLSEAERLYALAASGGVPAFLKLVQEEIDANEENLRTIPRTIEEAEAGLPVEPTRPVMSSPSNFTFHDVADSIGTNLRRYLNFYPRKSEYEQAVGALELLGRHADEDILLAQENLENLLPLLDLGKANSPNWVPTVVNQSVDTKTKADAEEFEVPSYTTIIDPLTSPEIPGNPSAVNLGNLVGGTPLIGGQMIGAPFSTDPQMEAAREVSNRLNEAQRQRMEQLQRAAEQRQRQQNSSGNRLNREAIRGSAVSNATAPVESSAANPTPAPLRGQYGQVYPSIPYPVKAPPKKKSKVPRNVR